MNYRNITQADMVPAATASQGTLRHAHPRNLERGLAASSTIANPDSHPTSRSVDGQLGILDQEQDCMLIAPSPPFACFTAPPTMALE